MFDESELFDKDDTIIIHKDKITLQKFNNDKSIQVLKKSLKELDGNWQLDICNEDKNIIISDSWISRNEKQIFTMFQELKNKSIYSDVLYNLTYNILCDYLETSSKSDYEYDNNDWNEYEEYKLYGMKNPNKNQWTSFHIREIHKLYVTYMDYYKLDKVKKFINLCFKNSETKRLPQY